MKKRLPKGAHRFDVGKTLPTHGPRAVSAHRARPNSEDAPEPVQKRRFGRKQILITAVLTAFIAILTFLIIVAVWDARNISSASQKMFGDGNIFSLLNSGSLNTDSNGRVNVLVVGYSVDDPGHQAAKLTDSILLLSMNQSNHSGYMLSIPRDLYVKIPGFGYGKINEAYQDGGVDLLKQIVSDDFGVTVPYYALVDYATVKGAVDALGGINVCIQSPDPRGLYDPNINYADGGPLKLANGCQNLNGQTALNLTRARGDPAPDGRIAYGFAQSDFDRTQHQRQVFTAIKQKLNWHLILDPRKNSKILNSAADNVKTNVQVSEAKPLFGLFNGIPSSQLLSVSLNNFNGKNLLLSTYYEGSTLSPAAGLDDYSQIQAAIAQLK